MIKRIERSKSTVNKLIINSEKLNSSQIKQHRKSFDCTSFKKSGFAKNFKITTNQDNQVSKKSIKHYEDQIIKSLVPFCQQNIQKIKAPPLKLGQRKTTERSSRKYKSILIDKNTQIKLITELIFDQLKTNFVISQPHSNLLSIKKEDFLLFLQKILICQFNQTKENQQFLIFQNCFPFLNCSLQNISKIIFQQNRKRMQQKLSTKSKCTELKYENQEYLLQKQIKKEQLSVLWSEIIEINKQIRELYQLKKNMISEYKDIMRSIEKKKIVSQQIQVQISKNDKVLKKLLSQIQKQKINMQTIEKQAKKILTFVGDQQNNKIVKLASQHYKQIEQDIYQYASYLQCNQLATDLSYEPISFLCLSQGVQQKLKDITKTIIQGENPLENKCKIMRDFLLQSIEKFRKKDVQQQTLLTFKTKCIRTFVHKMKLWLDNWTLKQEYLVNLRKQYVIDSHQMITKMTKIEQLCELVESQDKIKNYFEAMTQVFSRINNCYKMGNSFY